MAISKATKAWLDAVAEGNDHESLYVCEVFAALESGDGMVSASALGWLRKMANQRTFPLVAKRATSVVMELSRLGNAV